MKASIIIPTHQVEEREGNIVSLIRKLSEVLDPDHYEVIVVCNNGNVARYLGVESKQEVNILPGTQFKILNLRANYGLSYAWNRGLEHAKGEYVFFVNHDLILTRDENIFEEMIKQKEYWERLHQNDVFLFGVEGTHQSQNPNVRMLQRFQAGQFNEIQTVDEISGFLFGMKRSRISVAFFDEELSPCFFEEMDLCQMSRAINERLVMNGLNPSVNIIIPGIAYRHDFGVSSAHPTKTLVLWYNAKTKETRREDLWTINRRNKAYLERKWRITLE